MSKIDMRRKLLADEYGIYTDEELMRESNKLNANIEFFISVFGKSQSDRVAEGGGKSANKI